MHQPLTTLQRIATLEAERQTLLGMSDDYHDEHRLARIRDITSALEVLWTQERKNRAAMSANRAR